MSFNSARAQPPNVDSLPAAEFILRYQSGWKWSIAVGCLPMIALFVWVGIQPFMGEKTSLLSTVLMLALSVTMITLFVLGTIEFFIGRLTLKNNVLVLRSLGGTSELKKSEIESFRVIPRHAIIFQPTVSSGKKKMTVIIYFEDFYKLTEWAEQNLKNADLEEIQEENQEAMTDQELGYSDKQRQESLDKAAKSLRPVAYTSYALLAWGYLLPSIGYYFLIITVTIIPWIYVALIRQHKGAIRFDGKEGSKVPKAMTSFWIAPTIAVLRAMLDFHLIDFSAMVLPSLAIAAALATALLAAKDLRGKVGNIVFAGVLSLGYGYSVSVFANCLLDESPAQPFESKVLQKRVFSGSKHTSYYITLAAWGSVTRDEEAEVEHTFYSNVQVGDPIHVSLRPGKLGAQWFTLAK